MKIVLDENFPLALVRSLREEGRQVEHIILLGLRGAPDSAIMERLNSEQLLFLTHDQEFLELPLTRSAVIISRVTQSLPSGFVLKCGARRSANSSLIMLGAKGCSRSSTMESFVRGRLPFRIAEEGWAENARL